VRQARNSSPGRIGRCGVHRRREALAAALLSIALLRASLTPAAQAQPPTFQHLYSTGDKAPVFIHPGAIEQTSDGGGIAAGVIAPNPVAGSPGGFFVVKFAAAGSLEWSELLSLQDAIGGIHVSVRQTSDGGYIVAGRTRVAPIALIRLLPTGALKWAYAYDAQNFLAQFDSPQVREMSGGGFAVAGTEVNLPASLLTGVLLLIDAAGTAIGGGRYFSGGINTGFTDLRQNADGGFTIAGWLGFTSSPSGFLLALRTSPLKLPSIVPPAIMWAEDFGAASVNAAVEQVAGGFVFAASGPQRTTGLQGTTVVSTDPAGTLSWSDSFQGFSANSIHVTPTGNLLLGGSAGTGAPVHPAMIVTDEKGGLLQSMTYLSQKEGSEAAATVDGGALLVAGSDSGLLVVRSDATLASGCLETSFKLSSSFGAAGDQVSLTSAGGFTSAVLAVGLDRFFTDFALCPGTSCLEPPSSMVLWLPLDELSGPTSLNAAGGNNGTYQGSPAPAPGQVDGALCFDGVQGSVDVPSYPAIDFTTEDFSIDAWIRRGSGDGGVRVVVDKREESFGASGIFGYSLFLFDGALSFQLADGSFDNYNSTATVPSDGAWHHVAVTVSRGDPSGGRFYIDGKAVGVSFNPLLHAGSLASGKPLRVGAEAFIAESVFKGCIDEVEAFNRVLTADEIASLSAGARGKCKQSCFAPWASPFCPVVSSLLATEKICSSLPTALTFDYSFQGLPVSADCSAAGPTTFTPAAGSVVVQPGQCASVPVTIAKPSGLAPNQVSCYSMFVETAGGSRAAACRGSVQVPRSLCWSWNNFFLPIEDQDLSIAWRIDNTGSGRSAGRYEVSAVTDKLAPAPAISLNDEPPGVPVKGDIDLPAGGFLNLNLLAGFRAYQPGRMFTLLAQADLIGDGTLVPLASTLVQNVIPATCTPPSIVQRPASQTVAAGQPLTLSVVAADASPASYRWRRNGVDLADGGTLSGTTSSTLTITPAAFTDAGLYDVVVTSVCGAATSPPAAVSVSGETCAAGPTTLCLNAGRFAVTVEWQTAQGARGSGQAVQLTAETGAFSFFDPANIELAIKVLDACSLDSAFWVFAAGLTDVDVILAVTDTKTGAVKHYHNPAGKAFVPILDISAFATCLPASGPDTRASDKAHPSISHPSLPAGHQAASGSASPSITLVLGARFQLTARWQTAEAAGDGHTVPLSGSSGLFWFFDSSNLELLVKVLDGCGVNGRFWVFAGGLTDVQVELTVSDTLTGAVKTYTSPGGTAFLPIQDTGAFATCP
jgi:hypothetical protein